MDVSLSVDSTQRMNKDQRQGLMGTDGFRMDVSGLRLEDCLSAWCAVESIKERLTCEGCNCKCFMQKTLSIVPRKHRYVVDERTDVDGKILKHLNTKSLGTLISKIKKEKFESIGIGFLHSYANPKNEKMPRKLRRRVA